MLSPPSYFCVEHSLAALITGSDVEHVGDDEGDEGQILSLSAFTVEQFLFKGCTELLSLPIRNPGSVLCWKEKVTISCFSKCLKTAYIYVDVTKPSRRLSLGREVGSRVVFL